MQDTYNEILSILKESGYSEGLSSVTDSSTGEIKYISIYFPSILLYSKVDAIKKVLYSYDVDVSSNVNIECIVIKIIK